MTQPFSFGMERFIFWIGGVHDDSYIGMLVFSQFCAAKKVYIIFIILKVKGRVMVRHVYT